MDTLTKRNYTITEKASAAYEASKKEFINLNNQKLWDTYYTTKIENDLKSGKDLKAVKFSVNTYKPPVRQFEQQINGKDFTELTANDIMGITKGKNYITGFLICCVENDWIKLSAEATFELIPEIYRNIVKKVIKD